MTKIEWTHIPGFKGETWNPVVGCSVVSPGCTNCYAMGMAARIERMGNAPHYDGLTQASKGGPVWNGTVRSAPDHVWEKPLRWTKPRAIFVNSMGDLFADGVKPETLACVFAIMALCPQHIFIILTKRPARMRAYLKALLREADTHTVQFGKGSKRRSVTTPEPVKWPLPNVWLGVSVEDQKRADERVPLLLETPAAVRFVSCEPLLGPVDLSQIHKDGVGAPDAPAIGDEWLNALTGREDWLDPDPGQALDEGWIGVHGGPKLDWVIVGGESGQGARPMHPDWARSLRDQCGAARVPFFFKQWGEWAENASGNRTCAMIGVEPDGRTFAANMPLTSKADIMFKIGKKAAGHTLDGVVHQNWLGGSPELGSCPARGGDHE